MRHAMLILTASLILVAGPAPSPGQEEKGTPVVTDTRPAHILGELNKASYFARRAIPASENIFIENGQVIESLFRLTLKEHGIAIPTGRAASVSQVLLLDKAIHVFLQDNKCAVLILTEGEKNVGDMTSEQLLDLARKGLSALFTAKPGDKAKLPT